MGFLDKVKTQATQVAQKAQEQVKAGQAKLEEVQAKKQTDAVLRDLGAATFAEKTGRGTAETAATIEQLVAKLREHEAEHGAIDTAPTAEEAAGQGGAAEVAGGGDFTLDDVG